MGDGTFKSKTGYTVVQNVITKDKRVSLKAKGLYLVIQSFITLPNKVWKKGDFVKMVTEGERAFDSAWSELKKYGYLRVHAYTQRGKGWRYEFELMDEPAEGPHTIYYNSEGEPVSDNTNVKRGKMRQMEKDGEKDNITVIVPDTKGQDSAHERSGTVSEVSNLHAGHNSDENEQKDQYLQNAGIGKKEQKTQYPQNAGIGNQESETQYPHFRSIGNQSIGNRSIGNQCIGNVGINNKDLTTNTDFKAFISNPSVNQSCTPENAVQLTDGMNEGSEDKSDAVTAVTLDPDEEISETEKLMIEKTVEKNNGIPKDWLKKPDMVKKCIMVLTYWNDQARDERKGEFEISVFRALIQSLTEMLCMKKQVYQNTRVSNQDVLERLNIVLREKGIGYCTLSLQAFLDSACEKLQNRLSETKVKNIQEFTRTLLWNHFSTHEVEFQGYFHRTYYGIAKE